MDKMKQFIEAVKDNRAYDWILNNGYGMDKSELIRIIAEFVYVVHSDVWLTESDKDIIRKGVAENLKEHYQLPDIYFEEDELEIENGMVKIPTDLLDDFVQDIFLVVGLVNTDERTTVKMKSMDADYIYCEIID